MTIFDIETDGLLDECTKIHVLSYCKYVDGKWVLKSITDYKEMKTFLLSEKCLVGHNILSFDIPAIKKILDIDLDCRFIDTLGLSWYLEPTRIRHGLGEYGEEFHVPKPIINDWENLSIEDYINRCEEDVKINTNLLVRQLNYLKVLYNGVQEDIDKAVDHITFMMKVAAIQEQYPFKLDKDKTVKTLDWFENEIEQRKERLFNVLPKVPVYKTAKMPKNLFKKDGTLSVAGEKWQELLKKYNLPEDHQEPFKYPGKYTDPNPGSAIQIKNWLFQIGWKPETFNYTRSTITGEENKVPQIKKDGKLCPSIIKLLDKEPAIEDLKDLAVLVHRTGILKGFLNNIDSLGYIKAEIAGFTNTLRYRHKVCVNLPGVSGKTDFADGEWIRGCLTCDEGYEICGSDMSSLENRTLMHYIYDIDPDYIKEMNEEGYDPHLSMGITANLLSEEESNFYKEYVSKEEGYQYTEAQTKKYKRLHAIRHQAKTCNYSAIYLIGARKLSRTLDIPLKEAEKLLKGFWKKNWAIEKFTKSCEIKKIGNQMWVYLPVTKMWLSLRFEKDTFSTVNQGTGSYIFFQWVKKILKYRPNHFNATFHDEVVLSILQGFRDKCEALLRRCIQEVNDEFKLNVPLDISVHFGDSYASVH